jgi:hypothetical protein
MRRRRAEPTPALPSASRVGGSGRHPFRGLYPNTLQEPCKRQARDTSPQGYWGQPAAVIRVAMSGGLGQRRPRISARTARRSGMESAA